MITESEKPKTISISEFKAHCTEELRAVEEQGITLKITRHGKVIALVEPPKPEGPTMEEWIGSGAHLCEASDDVIASFDQPTWQPGDWNMERDDEPL